MFRPMDPMMIRELLKGQPDVLTPEVKAEEQLYRNLSCPMCGQSDGCEKRIRPPKIVSGPNGEPVIASSPFSSGRLLPQGYAHCIHCGTDFDPRSGVIYRTEATILAPPSDPHQE